MIPLIVINNLPHKFPDQESILLELPKWDEQIPKSSPFRNQLTFCIYNRSKLAKDIMAIENSYCDLVKIWGPYLASSWPTFAQKNLRPTLAPFFGFRQEAPRLHCSRPQLRSGNTMAAHRCIVPDNGGPLGTMKQRLSFSEKPQNPRKPSAFRGFLNWQRQWTGGRRHEIQQGMWAQCRQVWNIVQLEDGYTTFM